MAKRSDSGKTFGINVSFNETERAVLERLIKLGYANGFVRSEEIADCMKSLSKKIFFREDEVHALKHRSASNNGSKARADGELTDPKENGSPKSKTSRSD